MGFDLRYNLQHVGDIFVGAVQKTADSALSCSKGTILFYDIKKLSCRKKCIYREIGARVFLLANEGISDFSADAILSEHVAQLSAIEKDLREIEAQRSNLMSPFKACKFAFWRTTQQQL